MYKKRSRSVNRSTRKRAKYSRSTAARKIQTLYRRKRMTNRGNTLAVGKRILTAKVGKWNKYTRHVDEFAGTQQHLAGYDIHFPKGVADLGPGLGDPVIFNNNCRQKNNITVGGLRIQAILENCSTVPIIMNYMVVQNTRNSPGMAWDSCQQDFWKVHTSDSDNTPDFVSQYTTWDFNMAFAPISQQNFKILFRTRRVLQPQATESAALTSGNPAGDYAIDSMTKSGEKNVLRIDKYLQINRKMLFETYEDDKPYFPFHVLQWCTVAQPALFDTAGQQQLYCSRGFNTLFWKE